ncbi:cytochrome c biogenesis heme-transporting ATPase CcmA [Aquabacterium sp.]|uniref:cytochrome c biogenesis heme-transporting ATPase CcmA n=1 Tax=Aquabacterium sp. TaxID=1872578 RepID=UPI0025C53AED|nr:cytochrome c biogenesis heme-transporting ATPase CcmA [Aquabacterium sp.]
MRAQALACRRGARLLFDQLDLSVQAGKLVWVRGPNGQGKTSLLRLLAGLSESAEGQIERAARVVYLGHQHALKDDLSAQEALAFLVDLHGDQADEPKLVDALAHMGVKGKRHSPVRTLSQGQRRRVALARLLLTPPDTCWVLDEPFDALDDTGVATLNALLQAHRQAGGSVVLTSHQALTLPDRIELDLAAVASLARS